jgi:predicted ferric reductase
MGHRTSIDPTAPEPVYWPGVISTPAGEGAAVHEDRGSRGKVLFTVLFWFSLATSLALWWLDTPAHSLATPGDILVGAGRITGMVGGFVLLTQVLFMSRVGWLERWLGSHAMLVWHRELGGYVVLTVLAHVGFITVGYALGMHRSVIGTGWEIVTTYPAMISATIATGILVAIGILAIRGIRRRMPYELWYFLHVTSYLVLVLSYGHQFATGQELIANGFGRWYWIGLYVFVLACLAWGRVIGPVVLNARHRLRVAEVVSEAPGMISVYIEGRRLADLRVRAGQYFRWRFLARRCWWQAHPFSLSAAPNGQWLRLTIKVVGDHTKDLARLRRGVRIFAEGPSGVFTAARQKRTHALLIAGGSGIAPIRALLEELPPGAVVIYRAGSEAELLFREELEWLAQEREARVIYVVGRRDDPDIRHFFTPRGLRQLVPDARYRDVYLCGPGGLVDSSVRTLRKMRVPRRQLHLDPFEF